MTFDGVKVIHEKVGHCEAVAGAGQPFDGASDAPVFKLRRRRSATAWTRIRCIRRMIYPSAQNELLQATLELYYVLALGIWMIALDQHQALHNAVQEHGNP